MKLVTSYDFVVWGLFLLYLTNYDNYVKMSLNPRNKERINFKYNLSEYWSLLKNYKKLLVVVTLMTVLAQAFLVVDKYLFKIIIDRGGEFVEGSLSKEILTEILIWVAVIYLSIVIFRSVVQWLGDHFSAKLESGVMYDLKEKYINHLLTLSYKFHTTHKTGSLISRINRGNGAVENLTDIFTGSFLILLSQIIIVGASIAFLNLPSAIILILMTIVFVSYSFFIQHIQQDSKLRLNDNRDYEKGYIADIFTNVDSIKYFGKEKIISKRWSKFGEKVKSLLVKYWGYFRWFNAGQSMIVGVGLFFLIYFPLKSFLAGELELGSLVFIFTVYGTLVGPMYGFVWNVRSFYRAMADLQDLFEYGKIENDIKDKSNARTLKINNGEIDFRDVSFNYGKKRAFSLNRFNLKIKKNQKIAFVGHSGCGKTTLVKLLYRLYDVNSGEILIDKENIKNFKQESLREELSIVPQEAVLFDDTIYNNIKFSNPKASRKDVLNAIKFAQLDKVIENFPDKERTVVGERGVKLSGGEKQRVSIARAVLANKKILVLDEATSALDSETEYDIQFALGKLLKGRTAIMIAHRLSTIMNADRIIVMKKGKIIQDGKHEDLIKEKGEYQKLWNLQKGGYLK